MTNDVQQGVTSLEKAKKIISSNKDILGGTPRFKGARLPVHDIAEMLANEDDVAAVLAAYPRLKEGQVTAAATYAEAYPRRGRPRRQPGWAARTKGREARQVATGTHAPHFLGLLPSRRSPGCLSKPSVCVPVARMPLNERLDRATHE